MSIVFAGNSCLNCSGKAGPAAIGQGSPGGEVVTGVRSLIEIPLIGSANRSGRVVVLYWYQTPQRVIAGEWAAKFWLISDAVRERRTDIALVRLLVWSTHEGDEAAPLRPASSH
jgi:hypothetical protein